VLAGNAQFLGSRVFAMPGGSERILLLLDERDERLAAVIYCSGGVWVFTGAPTGVTGGCGCGCGRRCGW
jgi:hypothetical protein